MDYFKPGLTKAELKTRYRELAKQYHPDLHPDKSVEYTAIMKEVNSQYDNYFVQTYNTTQETAQETRHEIIRVVFMTRNKSYGLGFIGFLNGESYIGIDETWNKFRTGFAKINVRGGYNSFIGGHESQLMSTEFQMPNFMELIRNLDVSAFIPFTAGRKYKPNLSWNTYYHIKTQFGEFMARDYNRETVDIVLKDNDGVIYIVPVKSKYLGPVEILDKISPEDIFFTTLTGYTCEEFIQTYDVLYEPNYADTLAFEKIDSLWVDSPIVAQLIRKRVVSIYQSRINRQIKYGTFNMRYLMEYLISCDMEDIDEVQDYLDEINKDCEDRITAMIRKGKLRIKI